MSFRRIWVVVFFWLIVGTLKEGAAYGLGIDDWAMSGLLGNVTVDEEQWQRLDLQPRLRLGALEAVLDLELFLDNQGRIRDRGWDFSSSRKGFESVLRKIHYVRYGLPQERDRRLYMRLGTLESVTLGSGLLMRNYRNVHGSPGLKRTGLDIQIRHLFNGRMTMRAVVSDLLDIDGGGPIVGGRMVFHPAPQWDLGVTLVMDTDQLNALPDSIRKGRSRDAYGAVSADIVYPFVNGQLLRAKLYTGIARSLAGNGGTGLIGPGVTVEVGGLLMRGEYRWVSGRFQPGHFDALYDVNRVIVDPSSGAVLTREATLQPASMQGVFGEASLIIRRALSASGSYQLLTGDGMDAQIVEGRAGLAPELLASLPKVTKAEGYFEKRLQSTDLGGLLDGTPDTRFGYVVVLEPVSKVELVWEVEFTYEPDGMGGFQRTKTLNIQTKMNF